MRTFQEMDHHGSYAKKSIYYRNFLTSRCQKFWEMGVSSKLHKDYEPAEVLFWIPNFLGPRPKPSSPTQANLKHRNPLLLALLSLSSPKRPPQHFQIWLSIVPVLLLIRFRTTFPNALIIILPLDLLFIFAYLKSYGAL